MSGDQRIEGWGITGRTYTPHYFRGRMSLCFHARDPIRWTHWQEDTPAGAKVHAPDRCQLCLKKRLQEVEA